MNDQPLAIISDCPDAAHAHDLREEISSAEWLRWVMTPRGSQEEDGAEEEESEEALSSV
jgi:hypothetical protein